MKRIVIAITGRNTLLNAIMFATKVSKQQSVPIQAIFLKVPKEGVDFSYPFPNDLPATEEKFDDNEAENDKTTEDIIKLFEDECEAEGVKYKIEIDISIEQLIDETLDTDLVITSTKVDFLESLMPRLHCPTYLVSESEAPTEIIFLYDGSDRCNHAIKMFTSYFPKWKSLPASVVSINANDKDQKVMELYIKNELQPLFENLTIQSLQGNKEKELVAFLDQRATSALVVMGAFGRNAVSSFFHESLANTIIENTSCSLFVAH